MEASHYSGQLKQLEDYMLLKGYSPRTRQAYLGAARQYFRYREAEGLSVCMESGEVQGIANFESLRPELLSKAWCVNHQRPRADKGIIEEYLGKYICRIGITHKRLSYQWGGKKVRIEHND